MEGTTMVHKSTSNGQLQSSLNPKGKLQSSNKTIFSTTPSGEKQTVTTSGLVLSGKRFLQRDWSKNYLKKGSLSSQMQEHQLQSIIMNCPGESGIVGVVNGVLIRSDVI